MKKILVPTDFSDTALGAFRYAMHMAKYLGEVELKIVHVFMPEVSGEYNFMPPMGEHLKMREKMLAEFVEEGLQNAKVDDCTPAKCEQEVLVGFAVDEICNASRDHDLLIMGTTGEGGILGKLFGSVSSGVARQAGCPVLLVPKRLEFQPVHHILYACNYESAGKEMIEELKSFNRPFNAHVHFIHVKDDHDDDFQKTKQEVFEELFEEGEPAFAFEITEIDSKSISKGISDFAENQQVDLIVMVTHHRGILEELFHKSQTKEMVLGTHFPLLILHSDD